jgi:hypothetical protein
MRKRVRFCPSCGQYPAEARLVRVLEELGWQLTVDFEEEAAPGAFAVYLNEEMVFPGGSQRKLPDPTDIPPVIPTRALGDPAENEAGHGPV